MTHIIACVINDLTYDQRMIRCCSTLVDAGYSVTLVGRELPDSQPLMQRPFAQKRLKCRYHTGPRFYAEYNLKLKEFLGSTDFDIALACDLDTALAVIRTAKRKGRAAVYDAHEWFTEVPELKGREVVRRIWLTIGRYAVPRFAECYTVGPALARVLASEYGRPFRVVRNLPYRSTDPILPFEEREPVIFYQGALNAGRGLEQVIDAMEHVGGYELLLAGEGDLSDALRQRVRQKNLFDKVRFLGRVVPEKLPGLTRSARLGLNLLIADSGNYYYSLANKFFDYIQAGTPSVNMAFPEYKALLSDHPVGLTVADLDPRALAQTINSALTDRDQWNDMVEACETARDILCWENESETLLNIFQSILQP